MGRDRRLIVRVYAVVIHEGRVLVTDELYQGTELTKFPGGGMEWGEGTIDCLRRECREELGAEPTSVDHLYTTEWYQTSAFNSDHQILSIYYAVTFDTYDFAVDENAPTTIRLRWISVDGLRADDFSLPIDQHVARLIAATQS